MEALIQSIFKLDDTIINNKYNKNLQENIINLCTKICNDSSNDSSNNNSHELIKLLNLKSLVSKLTNNNEAANSKNTELPKIINYFIMYLPILEHLSAIVVDNITNLINSNADSLVMPTSTSNKSMVDTFDLTVDTDQSTLVSSRNWLCYNNYNPIHLYYNPSMPLLSCTKSKSKLICTILGSGTSRGNPPLEDCILDPIKSINKLRRYNPCLLIQSVTSKDNINWNLQSQYIIDVGKTFRECILNYIKCCYITNNNEDIKLIPLIKKFDGFFITHTHADATFGIDELREFLPSKIYLDDDTLNNLTNIYPYIFNRPKNDTGFVSSITTERFNSFDYLKLNGFDIVSIPLHHGSSDCMGYSIQTKFSQIIYLSDLQCRDIENPLSFFKDINQSLELLKSKPISFLYIDALRPELPYFSHSSWSQAENILKVLELNGVLLQNTTCIAIGMNDEISNEWYESTKPHKLIMGRELLCAHSEISDC